MASWTADGKVSGFGALSAAAGTISAVEYTLATNGAASDINGVTRFGAYSPGDRFRASSLSMNFVAGDLTAYPMLPSGLGKTATRVFAAGMAIVPASALPANPTVSQIAANAGWITSTGGRTTAGSITAVTASDGGLFPYEPNTKYWVLVCPVVIRTGAVTTGGEISITRWVTVIDPINVATNGRAISMWTNRTPTAPTVGAPSSGIIKIPGDDFALTITPGDPDAVAGGTNANYRDLAGVQVQYAPRPSLSNPDPAWLDLPFGNSTGTGSDPGWFIDKSTANSTTRGVQQLWLNQTVTITCSPSATPANKGLLPSGDWQLRVRTFNYGHPYPGTTGPLGLAAAIPDSFGESDRSPWSTPINVTVVSQLPPPLLSYPTSGRAVVPDVPVSFAWIYRNTALPPFAQATRLVEIRPVGGSWSTLVTGASAAASYEKTFTTADLMDGNSTQYEWRVQVTDTDGETSDWSAIARFWLVPALNSGPVLPTSAETAGEAGTLGEGTHRVEVYRRGGVERVGELKNLSKVEWGRVRDDISTAEVIISSWDKAEGDLLAKLQTWAYEIVIYRNNGFKSERVWEGPITLLSYERDKVRLDAKDVMVYPYRRIIKQAFSDVNGGAPVTARAAAILQAVMAPDDPNVLAYLRVLSSTQDAKQYRSIQPFSRTAFEEIDDMGANSGLDYTVAGRSIILWGTRVPLGILPEFRDEHLGESPIVSEYGMSMANIYSVSDGNGIFGAASKGPLAVVNGEVSGNDPTYGLVEMLSSTWASDNESDQGTYTQEGRQKVVESFIGYSERSIEDRYPPPVLVRVPENTSLSPETPLSIQHLIPGVAIPLRSTSTLRAVASRHKLDSVRVTEVGRADGGREEKITVTMSPFRESDVEEGTPEGTPS
jgi:hypothetical protein